ncbi:MAG: hypothetical protein KJ058_03500 [Thermoanaerobaculia bacterium]|nr:hypothetical protein [Thermoanaerobaculia bacterium]MCZ7651413.1 serine protease [Thermoanaerobaculia bacterium]
MARVARLSLALAALLLGTTAPLPAQETAPALAPAAPAAESDAPPLRLAERLELAAMHTLSEARDGAADELDALAAWNLAGNLPVRDGFARPLPLPLQVRIGAADLSDLSARRVGGGWLAPVPAGGHAWGTSIHVAASRRLRAELHGVQLPPGSRLWVWGERDEPVAFGLELLAPDGNLWTPSVEGPTIHLELLLPETEGPGEASFEVARVLESFELDAEGRPTPYPTFLAKADESCLRDAACTGDGTVSGITVWRRAIARLNYVKDSASYLCTGGLLNTTTSSFVPYLLTANHCFASQASASSLEAHWDYIAPSCGGPWPSLGSLSRSNGSTLLASNAGSDFTFVRLNSIPGSRAFLGWNANAGAVSNGAALYRLSHPLGYALAYSRSLAWSPSVTCTGLPTGQFLYSDPQPELGYGATFGGSSGSPVILAGGYVVGQLYGRCGTNTSEPCFAGPDYSVVDGRFATTFPSISGYLNPSAPPAPCTRNAETACLLSNRFEVKASWRTSSGSGTAKVMSFGGQRTESDQSVFYYFFDAANFEIGVKVLNGCGINNRFWIFFSGLTNQEVTVTVRDTQTGAVKTYSNPMGTYPTTVGDTSALPCP